MLFYNFKAKIDCINLSDIIWLVYLLFTVLITQIVVANYTLHIIIIILVSLIVDRIIRVKITAKIFQYQKRTSMRRKFKRRTLPSSILPFSIFFFISLLIILPNISTPNTTLANIYPIVFVIVSLLWCRVIRTILDLIDIYNMPVKWVATQKILYTLAAGLIYLSSLPLIIFSVFLLPFPIGVILLFILPFFLGLILALLTSVIMLFMCNKPENVVVIISVFLCSLLIIWVAINGG